MTPLSRLIKGLLRASRGGPIEKQKGLVELLTNSTVLAALITVAVSALVGPYIVGKIQDRSKANELELQAKKDYLKAQVEVDSKAYGLVGRYASAADDLITITRPIYKESSLDSPSLDELRKWKKKVADSYNDADTEWRQTRRTIGHLLAYYHHEQTGVAEAWRVVVKDTETFTECAQQHYTKYRAGATDEQFKVRPCSEKNDQVTKALETLQAAIETNRPLFWNDTPK